MEGIHVACSLITWRERGVFKVPVEQALSEVAQAGYEGTPANLRDGRSAEETLEFHGRFGLKPAPGSVRAPFWDRSQWDEILRQTRLTARYMRAVGLTEMFIMPAPLTRMEAAGHVGPEDMLSESEFKDGAKLLSQLGRIALEEGVRACFHNHVGCVIETREEMDRLFSLVDRDAVFLGPDFGHLAWAGDDVVQFCRDYADSIKTVHIKDINPDVMREGRGKKWDYRTFSAHGIFAELGEGCVDIPALFDILKGAGFAGWVVVETDVTQKPTALESATISRNYLTSIGV